MTDERTSIDMRGTLSELTFPEVGEGSLVVDVTTKQNKALQKDLFAVNKRKSWDKTVEARCDFTYKLSLTRRSDVDFISIWKKSVYGRTLTDIKGDPDMVSFFAENITPVISERIAASLGIPFYEDVALCHSKQRVNAVFEANNIPRESNIIVFDDFVTTGMTLAGMKKLLSSLGKNAVFFSCINNKL